MDDLRGHRFSSPYQWVHMSTVEALEEIHGTCSSLKPSTYGLRQSSVTYIYEMVKTARSELQGWLRWETSTPGKALSNARTSDMRQKGDCPELIKYRLIHCCLNHYIFRHPIVPTVKQSFMVSSLFLFVSDIFLFPCHNTRYLSKPNTNCSQFSFHLQFILLHTCFPHLW